VSPNPLKQIQEALEKVLHETGVTDFGRSMSSIDDLTAEVQHVYKRVDDIEQRMETIVPLLERLVNVAEGLEREIQPISSLASKVPGSGERKRRRQEAAAALGAGSGDAAAEDVVADRAIHGEGPLQGAPGSPGVVAVPGRPAPPGSTTSPAEGPGGALTPENGAWPGPRPTPGATATPGAVSAGPHAHRDATAGTPRVPPAVRPDAPVSPGPTTDLPSGGNVRPGATGYAPLGHRPRDERRR
jgi:hypothetical protein